MAASPQKRKTVTEIRQQMNGEPLVVLTAYTAPFAAVLDAHADMLLVGDSLGMVLYGLESTLPVSLEMMCAHGAAVVRSSRRALVVVDMPFGSYEESPEQAFRSASRLMKETGCQAVKLEGGEAMAPTVAKLTRHGIPVVGHIGLTPQHVHQMGGFKVQGGANGAREQLLRDMQALEDAGVFSIVVEGIYEEAVQILVEKARVPLIGIGASAACHGQVLVTEDMAGLTRGYIPKFVKQYAQLAETLDVAVATYAQEVKTRTFPAVEQTYRPRQTTAS